MEPTKDGTQQTVDTVKLIVASQLHIEADEYFYKLLVKDVVDTKREERRQLHLSLRRKEEKFEEYSYEDEYIQEYYLLPVTAITLAPGIHLDLTNQNEIQYGSILSNDVENGVYSTNLYHYFDKDFRIDFPEEVNTLNWYFSGKIVDIPSSNPRASLYLKRISGAEYYEVKLPKPLFIGGKNYKNVYLPSKGLLKGFRVNGFMLNPISLFQDYFGKKDEKVVLIANFSKKEDMLDNEDLKLFKKAAFYKELVNIHGWFLFIITATILWLNTITGIDFEKNIPLITTTAAIIYFTWMFHSEKNAKIRKLEPKIKDDLLKYKEIANIKGMIFWTIVWAIALFSFSKIYTYDSPYVHDTKKEILIGQSSFSIDYDEIFSKKKIQERYIHVYDSFTASLFYKNKNENVTAESKFLALDIKVKCNYGEHLLDIEKSITSAEARLQEDISNHKFGNWDKKDLIRESDFQKSLVDVKRTFWKYIIDDYTKNHDMPLDSISDLTITPRYTSLQ